MDYHYFFKKGGAIWVQVYTNKTKQKLAQNRKLKKISSNTTRFSQPSQILSIPFFARGWGSFERASFWFFLKKNR